MHIKCNFKKRDLLSYNELSSYWQAIAQKEYEHLFERELIQYASFFIYKNELYSIGDVIGLLSPIEYCEHKFIGCIGFSYFNGLYVELLQDSCVIVAYFWQ